MSILLSSEEMKRAEQSAIDAGIASGALMEKAGEGVASIIKRGWDKRAIAIACGPGNNGGDGFVVARLLQKEGWPVKVGLLGDASAVNGDAAAAMNAFDGDVAPLTPGIFDGCELIVDALFGTGLSRPIEEAAASIIEAMNKHQAPKVSIDVPSGVDANSGAVMGSAVQAARTVTFFLKKPGHLLFPGRALCGAVDVADIGISPDVLKDLQPKTIENLPQFWGPQFRRPNFQSQKFQRGVVGAVTGPRFATGAARLSARGALRAGAGLVTLLSPMSAADENASHSTSIMVRVVETPDDVAGFLSDPRVTAVLIGPGASVGEMTAAKVMAVLNSEAAAILDADALTSFENAGQSLFDALRPEDIITPHVGEFMRLFGGLIEPSAARLVAARAAAVKAGCIVVLKGADTIVAAPDGRASINTNAPPDLATAGSGDVLAGFMAGLRAQGMPGFEAACAGVWLHGACAQSVGPGLIAEDLTEALPSVYRQLLAPPQQEQQS